MRSRPLLLLTLVLATACGDSGESSDTDAGDGKVHPEPNGVHVSEDQACVALHEAFQDQAMSLGCSSTVRPCPQLLRVQFATACMEYDEGSVQGCVAFYESQTTCEQLVIEDCVATAYPGTEPGGCPQ